MRRLALIVCFPLVVVGTATAQSPNLDRGFDPQKLYQFGEVDAVDLYNGHLSLKIPLGPRFLVSERLSYGLTLTYNSNIWSYEEQGYGEGQFCTAAYAKQSFDRDWNAGIGFLVSLGEGTEIQDVDGTSLFTLHEEDGSESRFDKNLWEWDDQDSDLVFYDRKKYRRATLHPGGCPNVSPQSRCWLVEEPDGTRRAFVQYREASGRKYFRLAQITDAFEHGGSFPNKVTVSYIGSTPEQIRLQDSFGRVIVIKLITDIQNVEPKKFVQSVEFAGFANAPLRYVFDYYPPQVVRRSCKANCPNGLQPKTFLGRFLQAVIVQTGSQESPEELERWEFPEYYWLQATDPCSPPGHPELSAEDLPGMLKKVRFPTKGVVTYEYADRVFAVSGRYRVCRPDEPPDSCLPNTVFSTATAVIKRTRHDPFYPAQDGVWAYSYFFHENTFFDGYHVRDFNDELVTMIADPMGNDTAYFFAPEFDSQGFAGMWYAGLPFSILQKEPGNPNRHLSSLTFRGRATVIALGDTCSGDFCQVQGQLLRAHYVRYEADPPLDDHNCSTIRDCRGAHQREQSAITHFADDPPGCQIGATCTYRGVDRYEWDGYGHWQKEIEQGNSGQAASREKETHYSLAFFHDPDLLPHWAIHSYNYRWEKEGTQQRLEEACFDPTGFLLRTRKYTSLTGQRSPNDVVIVRVPDAWGNTAQELWYGSDAQPQLPSGFWDTLCELSLPSQPVYRLDHSYSYGVRSFSAWVDPATGNQLLVALDQDIDPYTGLPKTKRDSAEKRTDYEYDALGRLVWIKPEEGP